MERARVGIENGTMRRTPNRGGAVFRWLGGGAGLAVVVIATWPDASERVGFTAPVRGDVAARSPGRAALASSHAAGSDPRAAAVRPPPSRNAASQPPGNSRFEDMSREEWSRAQAAVLGAILRGAEQRSGGSRPESRPTPQNPSREGTGEAAAARTPATSGSHASGEAFQSAGREALQERWAVETEDPAWSASLSSYAHEAMNDLTENGEVGEVSCHTTLCRITLQFGDNEDASAFAHGAGETEHPKRFFLDVHEDGAVNVEVYLDRTVEGAPGDMPSLEARAVASEAEESR